jgi:hypothetical protein
MPHGGFSSKHHTKTFLHFVRTRFIRFSAPPIFRGTRGWAFRRVGAALWVGRWNAPPNASAAIARSSFDPIPAIAITSATAPRPPAADRVKPKRERRWLQKPDNQSHFRGPENRQRVQAWRKAHPGYWRKGKPETKRQDLFGGQLPENEQVTKKIVRLALQDLLRMQPALVVGLISALTGSTLQEDIVEMVHRLQRKGQDILGTNATEKPS